MRLRTALGNACLDFAKIVGLFPSIWFLKNPYKIYEFQELVRHAGLGHGHHVLDLGCGKGIQTQVLARRCGRIVGVDLNADHIEKARRLLRFSHIRRRVEYLAGRVEEAGFSPESFDHVFSICVLEHIKDPKPALAMIHALLKPGGWLHLSVDSLRTIADAAVVDKHRREHHVAAYYTPDTLTTLCREAGFDVIDCRSILRSPFAQREFTTRVVHNSYSFGFLSRWQKCSQFRREDERYAGNEGILVVAHVRKR